VLTNLLAGLIVVAVLWILYCFPWMLLWIAMLSPFAIWGFESVFTFVFWAYVIGTVLLVLFAKPSAEQKARYEKHIARR
jgi:hypothetical protein